MAWRECHPDPAPGQDDNAAQRLGRDIPGGTDFVCSEAGLGSG